MKKYPLYIIVAAIVMMAGCDKDALNSYSIEGKAQKGPFIVGTNITISELDENLNQTGKVLTTTIIDDQGRFEIQEFDFASNFVQLTADGYYYNEVSDPGFVTSDRMILKSIANLNESGSININILTHLELERLKYLMKDGNLSFSDAKKQCYMEILNIFELDPMETVTSEKLDISETGQQNDELLAISSLVQSNRNNAQLTEFLTRLQLDIKEDGVIDSVSLQSDLITAAVLINCDIVSQNIRERYSDLGLDIPYPNIEPVVDSFLAKSDYQKLVDIDIPETTPLGINILSLEDTVEIDTDQIYCIAVNQTCHVDYLYTTLGFLDIVGIDTIPSRKDVQITNIENWGDPVSDIHLFGSNEEIGFDRENFTGELNLQIEFRNHGTYTIELKFATDLYGTKRIMRYLSW